MVKTYKIIVRGKVQGVFFRAFTRENALFLGLTGYVKNLPDGESVEIVATGDETRLKRLLEKVRMGPPHARVDRVDVTKLEKIQHFDSFTIRY